MHFVFKFPFKLHLNFLFHFIFAEKLRLLVCKVLEQKLNLFCKLTLLPQSLVSLQFAFSPIFLQFTGHCKRQSKRNEIFLSHKTRKENHQQLEMKLHSADATVRGIFAQPSGFQIRAEMAVADFYVKITAMRTLYLLGKIVLTRTFFLCTDILSTCGQNVSEVDCCISTQYHTESAHREYLASTKPMQIQNQNCESISFP